MAGDDDDDDMMTMVTANGVGNLLKFGYWTTDGKDTLLAVTNLGKAQEMVTVKVVDDMGMVAGTMTVCLGASDTWTAAITASADGMGSTVGGGNPGSCSGAMAAMSLPAMSGLIEVYPTDMEGYLMGIATLVDPEMGFASSYNATSLKADLASGTKKDDIMDALSMEGGISKDMLLGRWGANEMIGGTTHIALTFPVPGSAPMEAVAISVADEAGNYSVVSSMMLDKAVNLCSFMTDMMGDTMLSCNGSEGMPVTVNQGWFKIMAPDGMMMEMADGMMMEMKGFPVIGMVSQVFDAENGMFDQSYPVQWMMMHDMDDEGHMDDEDM
jgi:hypothetical protein